MERRRTTVLGFCIHSVHAGEGAPVVLLHGLSGSHRWWLETIPALVASGFRVHVPELVGFGGSRRPARQPDLEEMANVVLRWMEAMGLERAHVVGHSMGGQVSIHLAALHPARVDRLVLVDASGIPRALTLREAARFVTEVALTGAWIRPRFVTTVALDAFLAGPRALARAARYILMDDVRPLLPAITCPTLLLWGALDPLTPLEQGARMAAALPDARLVVLPRAAHIPMIEESRRINAALVEFLAAA